MLGVNRREHLLLAEELIVVLFGLGIETRIVIGGKGLRGGRGRIHRLVQTAQAPRAGLPAPGVVAMRRFAVPITQQTAATFILGREFGTEQEQPQAVGILEVGIDRKRLDLGSADQVITGVVPCLIVPNCKVGLIAAAVNRVAIVISQVVVVIADRTPQGVPDNLGGDVGIVGVDQREGLSGDIADDGAMILRELYLRRIFFGRVLVRRRPINALGGDYFH